MQLAVLGTGLMGAPLAERLLGAGHTVTVYNRTRSKAAALRAAGALVAASPADALSTVDAVLLMLADATAIRATVLGADAVERLRGRTVIQMGTIGPDESRQLHAQVEAAGGEYLEAPVLGSTAEVRAGTLLVMVGATPAQYDRWLPLLRCLGPEPVRVGPVGHAATTKLALNQLIAALNAAFALSLGLVERGGIDVDGFMALLRPSVLYAPAFDRKLPRMRARNYGDPNFPVKHMLKDVRLVLETARRVGLGTAALAGVEAVLQETVAVGLADADYCALTEVVNPPPRSGR